MSNVLSNAHLNLVSVIVPFYNDSQWLVEALDSVIDQTYPDWEIIVIDDGSRFEHSAVAKNYCLQYPAKIKYIEHPGHSNRGVTISRNVAVNHSSGAYIAFLDADDKWLPEKLQHQLHLFRDFPDAQMIGEASRFWYSWNNKTLEDVIIPIGVESERLYQPPYLIKNLYPLGNGAVPCPSSLMIKRVAFERSGGFEPAFSGENTLYEDQAFLAKIYLSEAVYISGAANNWYRKRENSMSSGINDKIYYERVRKFFLVWLKSYLLFRNITDEDILALIRDAFLQLGNEYRE